MLYETPIIDETPIIGAAVKEPPPVATEVVDQEEQASLPPDVVQDLRAQIEALKAKIEAGKLAQPVATQPPVQAGPPKNHVPQTVKLGRKYVLQSKSLATWGKVPQQQADVADILAKHFEVGVPVDESTVFAKVQEQAPLYPHLAASVQDPTYVLKYYLNLSPKGNHAGLVARGFVQVVG